MNYKRLTRLNGKLDFTHCIRGFCFCGGKKTRVRYVCLVLIVQVGR